MDKPKIDIPEDLQQVCREFAEVARKNDLKSFSAKFRPPFQNGWGGDISFAWEAGRHGEDSNKIKITSEFYVYTVITEPKAK